MAAQSGLVSRDHSGAGPAPHERTAARRSPQSGRHVQRRPRPRAVALSRRPSFRSPGLPLRAVWCRAGSRVPDGRAQPRGWRVGGSRDSAAAPAAPPETPVLPAVPLGAPGRLGQRAQAWPRGHHGCGHDLALRAWVLARARGSGLCASSQESAFSPFLSFPGRTWPEGRGFMSRCLSGDLPGAARRLQLGLPAAMVPQVGSDCAESGQGWSLKWAGQCGEWAGWCGEWAG